MSSIIRPGARILYMKVGSHANEPLDAILARKLKEIQDEGIAFWGYGGGTCHPLTMVQPFARTYEEQNGTIYLCMEPMNSSHFAVTVRAEEFSVDGIEWKPVPRGINVTGSRYALVIKNLHKEEFDLSLARTRVSLGNSVGIVGSKYISGRVDKACLEVADAALGDDLVVSFVLRQLGFCDGAVPDSTVQLGDGILRMRRGCLQGRPDEVALAGYFC